MSSPPPHLSSFLSSCPPLSFVRPRRRLSSAPTAYCRGRGAQMAVKAGRSSAATPPGLRPLQQSSTTAGLMGRSINPVCYLSVFVSAAFGRSCYEVHGACDNRINLYPAAPIRLAKVLLAWTIAQEGWDSSLGRQIGKCRFAMRSYSHTSDPPDTPETGVSELSRRYRVRIAPCGTRPCST